MVVLCLVVLGVLLRLGKGNNTAKFAGTRAGNSLALRKLQVVQLGRLQPL